VRYRGQSHELEVRSQAGWSELRAAFEAAHRRHFGFSRPGEPMELVNLRSVATGEAPMTWSDLPLRRRDRRPRHRDRVWQRESLPAGFSTEGPALVVEANSAVLLEPGDRLTILDDGTLEIRS
jgi:N-methylhydantoinase A/oxoprolinase/acetone carboxylase beta subunit